MVVSVMKPSCASCNSVATVLSVLGGAGGGIPLGPRALDFVFLECRMSTDNFRHVVSKRPPLD
eukprot:3829791-Prymnesium_polylepis.1